MIIAPQSTVEKPLTAIDYIAELERCRSVDDVQQFSEQVPSEVLHDERYCKAVAKRLAAIHDEKAAA